MVIMGDDIKGSIVVFFDPSGAFFGVSSGVNRLMPNVNTTGDKPWGNMHVVHETFQIGCGVYATDEET